MAPDDLHAEHALGRRAKHRRRDHHGDDRGQRRDRDDFSDAPGTVDHRGEDQHRAGNRPAADVAHVRGQPACAGEGLQREQAGRLREPEHREPGEEAPPADGDERRDPEREIEADLERGQERDRALRIVERRAGRIRDHPRVERAEQARRTARPRRRRPARGRAPRRPPWRHSAARNTTHRAEQQLIERVHEEERRGDRHPAARPRAAARCRAR